VERAGEVVRVEEAFMVTENATMTTSYEAAPSTRLLATHCALCGRALRDAPSVERGIGPDCAEKHGYGNAERPAVWARVFELTDGLVAVAELTAWNGDAKKGANVLTHRIAAAPEAEEVPALIECIAALGFVKLAARLRERLVEARGVVTIVERPAPTGGSYLAITTENLSDEQFNALLAQFRTLPGRTWDKATKENRVPAKQKRSLWLSLQAAVPGALLRSGKGETIITRAPGNRAAA
jgi:hypothetical protein